MNDRVILSEKPEDNQAAAEWGRKQAELIEEVAIKKGITQERIAAVERMMKADATKEQIISFGYTEEEIERAENALYANVRCVLITAKNGRVFYLYFG